MRRVLVVILILAALSSATRAWAQEKSPAPTKIAVVNIGIVITRYEKAQTFKKQLHLQILPLTEKTDPLRKEMLQFQDLLQKKDFSEHSKEELEKAVKERKRAMDDLDLEVRKLVGKQSKEQLILLWKEILRVAKTHAESKGFALVLGYGDPVDAKEFFTYANIDRKMQGMDLGSLTPLYFDPSCDITNALIAALNEEYQKKKRELKETP